MGTIKTCVYKTTCSYYDIHSKLNNRDNWGGGGKSGEGTTYMSSERNEVDFKFEKAKRLMGLAVTSRWCQNILFLLSTEVQYSVQIRS